MRLEIRILKEEMGGIEVVFSYNPLFVEKVKAIKGWRWHPGGKYWNSLGSGGVFVKEVQLG